MEELSLQQQRLRLQTLLEAEQAKLASLAEKIKDDDQEALGIYQSLYSRQKKIIQTLKNKLARLDEPALRVQLEAALAQVATLQAENQTLTTELREVRAELAQCQTDRQ